ncbi:hypothetical protein GVN24_25660 [Rhizobium sp. CRIBSB]|nr:hypothetical protein [Rhizobium sp. CRIBSB]
MTHDKENGTADIAWMRQLAEENADTPMQGGSILMAAGLIYGLGSVLHWASLTGLLPIQDGGLGAIWLVATAMFLVALFVSILHQKRRGGVRTSANRASSAAWTSVGWGIFALFTSVAVVGLRLGQDTLVFLSLTPSIIMVFYGMGWAVSASMTKSTQLWWLAVGSFLAAPLLAAFSGQDVQYLAYAACLFLLMAVPGWLIMRRAQQG